MNIWSKHFLEGITKGRVTLAPESKDFRCLQLLIYSNDEIWFYKAGLSDEISMLISSGLDGKEEQTFG